MKKNKPTKFPGAGTFFLAASVMILSAGCKKAVDESATEPSAQNQNEVQMSKSGNGISGKKVGHFDQINLVANTTGYNAAHIDPTLINAWGIAFSSGGTAWVSSQAGHVSDVYNSEGATVLGPVHIPSPAPFPAGMEGGNPTGVVFNPVAGEFVIPGGTARFIFAGVDGVVSAWNGTLGTHAFRQFIVPLSAFTGLTLANNGGTNMLYAANFRAGKINVWDKNWNPVALPFTDPGIPAGYSPFNIQNLGGLLYVTYAKVAPDGRSQAGVGLGYVDIYNPNGTLVKRFASRETLNAPWGVAMAPASFFKDETDHDNNGHHKLDGAILIGNFGDGRINAYETDGKFLGQLRGRNQILEIEGLWAITFPPTTSPIDPHRLYFAAGPDDETHGLFGYIIARQDDDDDD